MSDEIEVGDRVVVSFGRGIGNEISGEVLYIPCETGDCWRIKGKNGLFYVQTFEHIWRPTEKEETP